MNASTTMPISVSGRCMTLVLDRFSAVDESHPLGAILEDAARGRFPKPDGGVTVLPSPPGPVQGVVAFTAHHVVAVDVGQEEIVERLPGGDLGGPVAVRFVDWLSRRLGSPPGSLDVVLAARGLPASSAPVPLRRAAHTDRERVIRAQRYRTDVSAYTDPEGAGVVVLGRGLAGRREVSFEVDDIARGGGLGRRLLLAIRALAPGDEVLFAQVAPGNAASLRSILAAGFTPIGSEVLFLRSGA